MYAVFKVHRCHDRENFVLEVRILYSVFQPSGDNEIRTRDLLLARQALSQLSYTPMGPLYKEVGLSGLEPPTSRLSGVRSNRLSYKPSLFLFYKFGSHLLSHTVSSAVPSAAWVLTIVFGMGTGVTPKRIATERFRILLKEHS